MYYYKLMYHKRHLVKKIKAKQLNDNLEVKVTFGNSTESNNLIQMPIKKLHFNAILADIKKYNNKKNILFLFTTKFYELLANKNRTKEDFLTESSIEIEKLIKVKILEEVLSQKEIKENFYPAENIINFINKNPSDLTKLSINFSDKKQIYIYIEFKDFEGFHLPYHSDLLQEDLKEFHKSKNKASFLEELNS